MREARQVKYIIAIGDGMADLAQPSLRDETPLSFAHTPCLDRLARRGRVGSTCLIPPGCAPGSLPAQLTLLGCPPAVCGCGRAALEALAHGPLADGESAVRCNLVALSDGRLLAHDGGGLTADEADALFSALRDTLTDETHRFLPGAGYRGLLVRRGAPMPVGISPDALLGQPLAGALPEDDDLVRLFYAGQTVLTDHPVNQARAARGQHPANGIRWKTAEDRVLCQEPVQIAPEPHNAHKVIRYGMGQLIVNVAGHLCREKLRVVVVEKATDAPEGIPQ